MALWAVIAQSTGFKTESPIMAYLCPDVQEAIIAYRVTTTGTRHVFPYYQGIRVEKQINHFLRRWTKMEKKWGLPYLRSNGLRHWVSHVGCEVRLSKPALAALMGHDTRSGWMSDWYNSPKIETILEEQAEKLPNGPLGDLDPPSVELIGMAHEDQEILEEWHRYKVHEIGLREFSDRAETIKNHLLKGVLHPEN